ncbi:dihydroorotate dehydrogenase-like protein [Bauldia sp.]|uniref:dihydroorotate dehydrogenase-like protein n=1 Tax=Bauldia sp. TaxID=2575872 RepID=UPI003BA91D09
MVDLSTTYLNMPLAHPVVASASPLGRALDDIRRLEDAGAAAVVLPSIYEEEVEAEDEITLALVEQGSWTQPEAGDYFPARYREVGGLDSRLEAIRRAREACEIPIIASLNGSAPAGWVEFSSEITQAGASAIELNIYRVPANLSESGAEVERQWLDTVAAVRAATELPLAVKLGPWLSSPGHFARGLVEAGANGLVLFNRFYQPDIDLTTLTPKPDLQLSHPYEIRQALLWIALLRDRVAASLAATSGVETAVEVVKYVLAGADVVMTASALLRHGPQHIGTLRDGLADWIAGRGFEDVGAMRGRLAADRLETTEPLLRAQYAHMLLSYDPAAA